MDGTSRRKVQYKKTNDGLDRRALRAHRRSVEWKSFREDTHNERRRNLSDDLSPVKEAPSRPPTPPQPKIPIDPMRIKLEKWQAKRELKRQIEKRTKPQKPIFKCTALKPEEYDVTKLKVVKTVPVPAVPAVATRTRATRACTNKPAPKTRQQAPAPARTTRVTVTEPTTQQRGRTTRTRKPAAEPVPTGRVTRSRSTALVSAPPPKPEPKAKRTSKKPVAEVPQAKPQKATSRRTPLVLNPVVPAVFDFKPLSPRSVESYLNPLPAAPVNEGRRCSTPKDTVTYRFRETPALSAIPPTSQPAVNASDSMNRDSPILKIVDAVKNSPIFRRNSRRSVLNLPVVEDTVQEETPEELTEEKTTDATPVPEVLAPYAPVTEEAEGSVFDPTATTSTTITGDNSIKETQDEEVEKKNCTTESAPAELETEQIPFRTPRTATKANRRRTTSAILSLGRSAQRTPKALRQSFILRHLSPEEGVEVLKMSPMIEMDRRKRKSGSSPYRPNPMPSFDDIDDIIPPEPEQVSAVKDANVVMKENITPADPPSIEPITDVPMETDADVSVTLPPQDEAASTAAPEPAAPSSDEAAAKQIESAVVVEEKHDVPYFRALLVSQTERLNAMCATWENVLTSSKLTEEDEGEVRTSIGKAQLLVAQRFKQFRGLVDNCEFNTGEKVTTCEDLGGFWDMVYFQVEDIDRMFATLEKLQANGWQREKPKVVKKKVLKKKPVAAKPAVKGRSNFRMFMAIKKKMNDEIPAVEEQATSAAPTVESGPSTSEAATQEAAASIPEVASVEKVSSTPATAEVDSVDSNQETAALESGAANLEVPVVIPAMGEALEAGIFMTRSPAKTPREHSKGNTPRRRSGRSMGVTPGAVTPLMRTLLERNARRSIGANSIPKKAGRKSETTTEEPQRRLSSSEQSVRSKRALESTTPSTSGEKASSAVVAEEDVSTQPIHSLPVCLETAPSLFTPETCPRRSSRRSEADHSLMETSVRCEESEDPFLKYLQPTVTEEGTDEEPKQMEQGSPPIEDVDMAASMKRDLISEFNLHAASAKKRHSLGPSSRRTPVRQSLPSEEKLASSASKRSRRRSGAASTRRSVQFNFVALPEDEAESTNKVPGTPANRRRLDNQKENQTPISGTNSAVVDTETPATKLARLCVGGDEATASPARLKRKAFPSLLYTPTQEITNVSFVEATDNLMSFSPVPDNPTTNMGSTTPVGRTRRKSNRLSLL